MIRGYRRRSILLAVGIAVIVAAFAVGRVVRASPGGPFTGTVVVGAAPMGLVIDTRTGHTFAANADSGSVSMIDTTRGTVLGAIDVGGTPGMLAVDDRTGRVFVITAPPTGPESVSMLDSHTGVLLRTVAVGRATSVQGGALAVDERRGRVVVTNAGESSVSVLDARSGAVRRTFTAGLDPTGVTVDPRSGQAYVADTSENKVLVLDVTRGRVLRALPVAGSPVAVRVDAATGRLSVTGYDTQTSVGSAAELDGRSGRVLLGAGKGSSVVVADPGAAALYTVDVATDSVFVTTPRAPMARKVVSWGGGDVPATAAWPRPVTVDPRTGYLFVLMDTCGQRLTPSVAGCVRVIDPRAGRLVATIPVGRAPSALAVDGLTGRVFVANSRGGSGARAEADWASSWLRDHLSWLLSRSPEIWHGLLSVIRA